MLFRSLILFSSFTTVLMACSCQRYHPQEHFCQDDYASGCRQLNKDITWSFAETGDRKHIQQLDFDYTFVVDWIKTFSFEVLKIKVVGSIKFDRSDESTYIPGILRFEKIYYPIRILKVYKGNITTLTHVTTLRRRKNKVRYISRLYVPSRISSCSLSLTQGQIYVVMGQIHEDVLHHGLCNWRSLWKHMTSIQILGLKRHYAKGCECSIRTCPTRGWCKKSKLPTECRWVSNDGFGVTKCVDKWQVCRYRRNSRTCKWRKPESSNFKKCVNQVRWP